MTILGILGTIGNYRAYRRAGLRNAWRLAGMHILVGDVIRAACVLIFFGLLAYQSIDRAKAAEPMAPKHDAQQAVIDELTKIVTACLSDGDRPLWIGNELYLCGASRTGVTK